jgi:hypothetical protein
MTILKKLTDFERGYEQGKADAQKPWVGLTDNEVAELAAYVYAGDPQYLRLIESKLKEKNT